MARRRHKRNPRSKYKVRHVVLKKNGSHRRRRRRNPAMEGGFDETGGLMPAPGTPPGGGKRKLSYEELTGGAIVGVAAPARGYRGQQRAAAKHRRAAEVKRLRALAKRTRKGARGRGVTAMAKRAQAARIEAVAAVLSKRGKAVQKSPLIKAMTVKSNPGLGGLRLLVPQAVASTAGFVGSAYLGKMLADALIMEKGKDGVSALKASYVDKADPNKQTMLAKYAPALGTLASSIALWVAANRLAPRFQIGIALGGMSAAIMQAVLASDAVPAQLPPDASFAKVVKHSLGLGEYTTVGSGIFHGVGEYTTVGQAHPFRPRNYGDNAMEWAATGGLGRLVDRGGADNATEFAPGEGGIFAKEAVVR